MSYSLSFGKIGGILDKEAKFFEDNQKSWNSIAHMHAQGSGAGFYRIEQFLDGECQLGPWEPPELNKQMINLGFSVSGKGD